VGRIRNDDARIAGKSTRAERIGWQTDAPVGHIPRPQGRGRSPEGARTVRLAALTIAAEGSKTDIAKPLPGLGSGVFEIALPFGGDAFRVVYAVQNGEDTSVVHTFQKKSPQGIKTPKHEIDLVRDRLKRLKEMLR
jgi:phage-related protein